MSMNLLALDASTEALSVALQFNGNVFSFFEVCPQQHSQKILPTVDSLLKEAGCSLKDLDGIVFGRGPGSFTGVRIGVSIAQGLAFASNLTLVGVSTLQAMAQQAIEENIVTEVIAGIDARMDEIYFCEYRKDENGIAIEAYNEGVIRPEFMNTQQQNSMAVGTAWQTYPNVLDDKNVSISEAILYPDARFMLPIGIAAFEQGLAVAPADAQPHYVRDTVTWKKLPGRE